MEYKPRTKARTFDKIEDVVKWTEEELEAIAKSASETDRTALRIWNSEPPRPRDGQIVFADGTNWDPGSGRGPYVYSSGKWVPMFTVQESSIRAPGERLEQEFTTSIAAAVLVLPEINGVEWMGIAQQGNSTVDWYEKDADTGLYDPTPVLTWTNANFDINQPFDLVYCPVDDRHFVLVCNYSDGSTIAVNSFVVEFTASGASLSAAKHTVQNSGGGTSTNIPTVGANNGSFRDYGDGRVYFTIANEGDSVEGWTQNSLVYKWDSGQARWEFYQAISGTGCRHLALVGPGTTKHLAKAQFYSGTTHAANTLILSFIDDANGWNTTASQTITTHGANYVAQGTDEDDRYFIHISCREQDQNVFQIESPLRLWNGSTYEFYKDIRTNAAVMSYAFNDDEGRLYFAIVNNTMGDGDVAYVERGTVQVHRVDPGGTMPIYSFRAQGPYDVVHTKINDIDALLIAESQGGNTDVGGVQADSTLRTFNLQESATPLVPVDLMDIPLYAKTAVFGGSITDIPTNSTAYLNTLGQFSNEAAARMPFPFYGRVMKLRTVAGNTPGGAAFFTYTLYIAGAATNMTFIVPGGENTGESEISVPFANTFSWSLRVDVSSGANATTHTFALYLEPT